MSPADGYCPVDVAQATVTDTTGTGELMLYSTYQLQRRLIRPVRATSGLTARALHALPSSVAAVPPLRQLGAACDIVTHARPTHYRPDWGIDSVQVGDQVAEVTPKPMPTSPFAPLLHFAKHAVQGQRRVLLVGPMSGHFTTLLRPTIRTLLTGHDVHVLD